MVGLSLVLANATATTRAKNPNQPLSNISIQLIPYLFCFYNPHQLKKIKKIPSCFSAHTNLCDFKMVASRINNFLQSAQLFPLRKAQKIAALFGNVGNVSPYLDIKTIFKNFRLFTVMFRVFNAHIPFFYSEQRTFRRFDQNYL